MDSSLPTARRYTPLAQFLHWLIAVLVLAAFILGPEGPEGSARPATPDVGQQLHETFGLAVLVLSLVRLGWRTLARLPDPEPAARWIGVMATIVQYALYVLLLAVPLTGILGAWLQGDPVTWLGGSVDSWVVPSHRVGRAIAELHEFFGEALLWVAGLHAAAALFHHYVLKDGVLRAMLPFGRR